MKPVDIKPIRVDVKSQPVKAIRLDAKDGTVIQLNSDDKVKPVIITSPVRLDVKIKSDVKAVIVSPKIKKTKADSDTKRIRLVGFRGLRPLETRPPHRCREPAWDLPAPFYLMGLLAVANALRTASY